MATLALSNKSLFGASGSTVVIFLQLFIGVLLEKYLISQTTASENTLESMTVITLK